MKKDTLHQGRLQAELNDLLSPKSHGRMTMTARQARCRIKTLRRKLNML